MNTQSINQPSNVVPFRQSDRKPSLHKGKPAGKKLFRISLVVDIPVDDCLDHEWIYDSWTEQTQIHGMVVHNMYRGDMIQAAESMRDHITQMSDQCVSIFD